MLNKISLIFTFPFLFVFFISCKKNTEIATPFPEKTNPNLTHFGYTLIDAYWDDPEDQEEKTNYADEVASFSNLADILVLEPTDHIVERVEYLAELDLKAILHLNEIFFEHVGEMDSLSGANYDLRADYAERWDTFIATNDFLTNHEDIGVFYLGEEPTWNGISAAEFEEASSYIKATIPEIPILLIEAYPAIASLEIPPSVDWIGFDHYFIADPSSNTTFQEELALIKSKKTADQDLVLILDAHYIPFAHGSSGIAKSDMDQVARNYYQLANSETAVVAMLGYHWPSGFDIPSAIGTRHLPEHVKEEHQRIGKAITGK